MKNKRLLTIVAIITIAATLTGCVNPNADQPASWNPLTWFDSVKGCVSPAYQTPDGKVVVMQDGELTPDGKWMCVSKGPDGPYGFKSVTTTTPTTPVAPADKPAAPKDTTNVGPCVKHGNVAYTDGNAAVHNSVIGGATENCSIVGQVHGKDGKGYVIALGPTQWIRLDLIGGTGWYIDPTQVESAIENSVKGITDRGEARPAVVRFDKDGAKATMTGLVEFTVGPKGSK